MKISTFFEDLSYTSFFRISISFLCLTQVLSYNKDFNDIFSGAIISHDLMSAGLGRLNNHSALLFKLIDVNFGINHAFYFVKYLYLLSLVCLTLGYKTRIAAIIAFLTNQYLFFGQELFTYGYDAFLSNSLLFCCVFKTNYNTSLDRYLANKHQIKRETNPETPTLKYVIRVTLCVVYLFSGLSKAFDGMGWWNGNKMVTALHFNSSKTSLDTIDFLLSYPILLVLGGISTVLLEILYSLFIFPKITRNITMYITIIMHLLIAILLKLPAFSAIMIIWNLTAFQDFTDSKKVIQENEEIIA